METKYHYPFWRPETAIHDGALDHNPRTKPDPAYRPYIVTPFFPSYPSAHASASYAARKVLAQIFGNRDHSITLTTPGLPGVVLRYNNLTELVDDIGDSRIYGGIHYRFDTETGSEQGTEIGRYVYRKKLHSVKRGNFEYEVH